MWYDNGKIAGETHLLVVVSPIYNPAVYFTNEEMLTKGVELDVPTIVEHPQVHILARCGSSDAEQSMIAPYRLKSILSAAQRDPLKTTHCQVTDTLRFSHDDKPAQQHEMGNNKGGNYPCVTCTACKEHHVR